WLNNQQGRSKTKQEGTPGWPKSPRSIYALPLLDRPGDRASGACDRTAQLSAMLNGGFPHIYFPLAFNLFVRLCDRVFFVSRYERYR
ncbi:MAG TPA: hypothetical protein VFQ43_14655, partial [Nitrososphaera sp.]|nr:hypothetical protein [Nitrososphaera sp.]